MSNGALTGVKAFQIKRLANAPDSLKPGEPFQVSLLVTHSANIISFLDPDACGSGANPCTAQLGGGRCVRLEWEAPDGSRRKSEPRCMSTTELGSTKEKFTAEFQGVRQKDKAVVKARIVLEGSNTKSDWVRIEMPVTKGEPTVGEEPKEGHGGGGGGGSLLSTAFANPVGTIIVVAVGGTLLRETLGGEE